MCETVEWFLWMKRIDCWCSRRLNGIGMDDCAIYFNEMIFDGIVFRVVMIWVCVVVDGW